jgi:ADP-heptose:LPS heptosyltransferase
LNSLRKKLLFDYYAGGLLHVLFKPLVVLLGRVLRRDHDLRRRTQDVTVLKILGGGSLVIAYPSLLALKRCGHVRRLRLVVAPGARAFGDLLGLFDEVIVIRDSGGPLAIFRDAIAAWWRLLRTDTIVDLEVHSRLSTIFCLFTCARNRVSFYTADSFWRKEIATHLLFCNQSTGIYFSYDQVAKLFGATTVSMCDASRAFLETLARRPPTSLPARGAGVALAVAPCCSELGKERMLRLEEWGRILRARAGAVGGPMTVHLLGSNSDKPYLEELRAVLERELPASAALINHAGALSLRQSVHLLRQVDELLAVDSSMLHFARLMGVNTTSYWGPTDPGTRLRPSALARDVVHYSALPCSPCVHITAVAPCKGNNLCMRFAVDPDYPETRNPCWLA